MSIQPPSRKPRNDYGIIGPGLLIVFAVALIGFWPVMVWHGYGGPTGNDWRWDIHSTIAEGTYLGVIGFIVLMAWLGSRPAKTASPPRPERAAESTSPPPAPPLCLHRNAVRVESAVNPAVTLENWCPDCETPLGVMFRRSCCSTPPGSRPGDGHLYNCPHRKESR